MFKLEIVRNTPLGKKDSEDISVSEAISSSYLDYKPDVLLYWDDLVLCLSRRGDISDIYDDVVDVLTQLEQGVKPFFMAFLSSSFTTHWDFKIIDFDMVMINAKWIDVLYLEEKMSSIKKSNMIIPISDFTEQWKNILKVIKKDLLCLGYDVQLEGFEFLEKL